MSGGLVHILEELVAQLKKNTEGINRLISILEGLKPEISTLERQDNLAQVKRAEVPYDLQGKKRDTKHQKSIAPIQSLEETQKIYEQMKEKEFKEINMTANENTDILSSQANSSNPDTDYNMMMLRRADYHKKNGTFNPINKENNDAEKKLRMLKDKLSLKGQEKYNEVIREIFKQAMHNVRTLLNIDKNSDEFESQVKKEADRLLEVWGELN